MEAARDSEVQQALVDKVSRERVGKEVSRIKAPFIRPLT